MGDFHCNFGWFEISSANQHIWTEFSSPIHVFHGFWPLLCNTWGSLMHRLQQVLGQILPPSTGQQWSCTQLRAKECISPSIRYSCMGMLSVQMLTTIYAWDSGEQKGVKQPIFQINVVKMQEHKVLFRKRLIVLMVRKKLRVCRSYKAFCLIFFFLFYFVDSQLFWQVSQSLQHKPSSLLKQTLISTIHHFNHGDTFQTIHFSFSAFSGS